MADLLSKYVDIVRMFSNSLSLDCPHCDHKHKIDSEVCIAVVSYWGDDVHDFSCFQCGKDFFVHEIVTRRFKTSAYRASD